MALFKKFTPEECILKNDQIDIWQFPLSTPFDEAKGLLNEEELNRANQFYFERHQRRFTIARAMVRIILAHYLKLSAKEITFSYNKYGKPALSKHSFLHFNLSHSADLALLAIGQKFALGVDLEYFSPRPYEEIGEHIFSAQENTTLQQLPNRLKPLAFFHLWAQKEALIKACGLGLSYPTKQFDLPLLPPTHLKITDPQYKKEWQIISFMPQIACCAAICFNPKVKEIRYIALARSGLIST